MRFPGRMVLAAAVVTGGISLGALLGSAANPEMKMRAEQPWLGALQPPVVVADAGYRFVEAGPVDLSPYPYPDRYAPAWASEVLAEPELDYPVLAYSDFDDENEVLPADEQAVPGEPEAPAPLEQAVEPFEPEALAPEPTRAGQLAALY